MADWIHKPSFIAYFLLCFDPVSLYTPSRCYVLLDISSEGTDRFSQNLVRILLYMWTPPPVI